MHQILYIVEISAIQPTTEGSIYLSKFYLLIVVYQ